METGYVEFDNLDQIADIFGPHDRYVDIIEKALNVLIKQKEAGVHITGEAENVKVAKDTISSLKKVYNDGNALSVWAVNQALEYAAGGASEEMAEAMADIVAVTHKGKPVSCKTAGQKRYVNAIKENTITICTGPAGTGKTYLAMALAVTALKRKEISKIVLTRPAVEAGEKLGFLPGDLQEKVDPYLTPLYDALGEFLGEDKYAKLEERGVIEAAPLAFMRGRTLKDCFVVLDEAQNCTTAQMKMFLTRLGENSKMVITGDVTQTDLPKNEPSGLEHAIKLLCNIEGIATHSFGRRDVIRHPLVQQIIDAYERVDR